MGEETKAELEGANDDDPATEYPTSFLLDRIRKTGRRRRVYWILVALFMAAAALSFIARNFT